MRSPAASTASGCSGERVKPIVIGLPSVPNGGSVGVDVGLVVGVTTGADVSIVIGVEVAEASVVSVEDVQPIKDISSRTRMPVVQEILSL